MGAFRLWASDPLVRIGCRSRRQFADALRVKRVIRNRQIREAQMFFMHSYTVEGEGSLRFAANDSADVKQICLPAYIVGRV